jgi:NAD(P)H-nitrite reductase large subunit
MHHVIIGAGPAGIAAAESIRQHDKTADVTVIHGESGEPYSRMAIPYYLVGQIPAEGAEMRKDAAHFSSLGITIARGRVTGLNADTRHVILADGTEISYDRLLIASGSSPVRLPIPGIDLPGVVNCWTMEDAHQIADVCHPGNRAVLIGAGFIGCIILEALTRSGVELTVVEAENRMVPRMMNEVSGGLIKRWCENLGVNIHTSSRVREIDGITGTSGQRQLRVVLDSGETYEADMVIAATGVRPNTDFLSGSGITVENGILVDECFRTNLPGVFAAGDVCQGFDFSTGLKTVQAIQPTAVDHGRYAAANMVGVAMPHPGSINMNVLDTMGLVSSSFGLWMGVEGGDSAELVDEDDYRYINLQFRDDVLVGASSLGLTNHVGVLRGLIQSKCRLGKWKSVLLDNPMRFVEAYIATSQHLDPYPR